MISLNNINKYFFKGHKNEIHVLDNVSLSFPEKGLVVLSGPSGSGKTTFLNVLGGLDGFNSGQITFKKGSINKYSSFFWDNIRREKIGYIFQNYNLVLNMTVYENIAIVLRLLGLKDEKEIEERVSYVLLSVGMLKFKNKKANELSGGQQQRIAIARALVKKPEIIIADEPTGNLDNKNSILTMNIIKQISKECLVVLVTHEKELALKYGDRIIEFIDGKIVNDFSNNTSQNILYENDPNTIYLKDLKYQNSGEQFSYFSDTENDTFEKELKVVFVHKNGSLHLLVDSPIKNIKLNTASGIAFIDDHQKPIEDDSFTKIAFNVDPINSSHKSNLFTFKSSLKMAWKKFFELTVKGKMMMIALLFSGLICALATATFGNRVLNKESLVHEQKNIIAANISKTLTPETIKSLYLTPEDEIIFIPYNKSRFTFRTGTLENTILSYDVNARLGYLETISQDDLIFGRMPERPREIVVDQSVYKNNPDLGRYGIWEVAEFIGEITTVQNITFTITGIVDTKADNVYASRTDCTFLSVGTNIAASVTLALEFYEEAYGLEILCGQRPKAGSDEILLPEFYLTHGHVREEFFLNDSVYLYDGKSVSGVFRPRTFEEDLRYLSTTAHFETISYQMSSGVVRFYTTNPAKLFNAFIDDSNVTWPYQVGLIAAEESTRKMIPLMISSFLIFVVLGFGNYFMTKSSLITKIKELSVYRALGSKKSTIFRHYLIESFVTTSFSSLIGLIIGTIVFAVLQNREVLSYLFYADFLTFLFGLILLYLLNTIVAVFSISSILRKTPSQLLYEFDL